MGEPRRGRRLRARDTAARRPRVIAGSRWHHGRLGASLALAFEVLAAGRFSLQVSTSGWIMKMVCFEQREQPAAWIRDLQALSNVPVTVQLSPDIGVDLPVEVFDERGPGYVGQGTLGLSRDLEGGLT